MLKIKASITGVIGGFVSGMTGIGGGTVMVPLLTGFVQMRQHRAHATSLVIVIFVAISAATQYLMRDQIRWDLAIALSIGAVVGAQIGARTMHSMPEKNLRIIFAIFLFVVGVRLIFGNSIIDLSFDGQTLSSNMQTVSALLIGLIGGAFGGLLGIGGGAIFVPALVLILGQDQHIAQGVSLIVIISTALSGTAVNLQSGYIDKKIVIWVTPPAIVLAIIGGYIAGLLDSETLSRVFGIVVLYVAIRSFYSTWKKSRQTNHS